MTQYYVGVDLHKTVAQVCVLDSQGEIVKEWRQEFREELDGAIFVESLLPYTAEGLLAVEAVGCNRWFVRLTMALKMAAVVVHPAAVGLRAAGRKTDRRDAYELARRLRLGDLQEHALSYFPTEREYARRKVTRIRHNQVQRRQETVSHLRAMLSAAGVRKVPPDLTTKKGIEWLQGLGVMNRVVDVGFQVLVSDVVNLNTQIAALDAEIGSWAKEEDLAPLATTLPYAGIQTVATVHCELGDVSRFRGTRKVAAFAGLAPRVAQSGEGKAHTGPITKQGNPELRWILVQWAVRLLAFHPAAKAWAKARKARGSNKLRSALARKLLVGVYHTLKTGEVFSLEKCLGVKTPLEGPPPHRAAAQQVA